MSFNFRLWFKYSGYLSLDTFQVPQEKILRKIPSVLQIMQPLKITPDGFRNLFLQARAAPHHNCPSNVQQCSLPKARTPSQQPDSLHMSEIYYRLPKYPPSVQP